MLGQSITPNPNDNPPPPGTDSTPYHHGAGNFGAVTAMASTVMHPAGNFGVVTPHAVNNVTVTTKQPGIIQSVQCEVCNITCSSADVFKTHELGKKHMKNLQKQAVSSVIASLMPTPPAPNTPSVGELENKKHRLLQNGASVDTLIHCDLCNVVCNNKDAFQSHIAGKKHSAKAIMQQAGASGILIATSEGVSKPQPLPSGAFQCELCKISCTSNELLKMHISGKKHQKKLKELVQLPDPPLTPIASLETPATKSKENPESTEGKTVILHEIKATSCEICGISCYTYDVLKTHLIGKKHLKNLEKLMRTSGPHIPVPIIEPLATPKSNGPHNPASTTEPLATPKPSGTHNLAPTTEPLATPKPGGSHNLAPKTEPLATPTMIDPLQDSLKEDEKVVDEDGSSRKGKRAGSHEDLEIKKQKVMQGGGSSDALRACTVCNIVCNSPTVFDAHLASKKHAATVLKQAEPLATAKTEPLATPTTEPLTTPKPSEPHNLAPTTEPLATPEPSEPHNPTPTTESLATLKPSGSHNLAPKTELLATPMMIDPLQDSLKEDEKVVNEDGSSRKGKRVGSHEDFETKKQKIMQVGGSSDGLRACTVCNVVCNSPTVFEFHLASKKHAAMVLKQAEPLATPKPNEPHNAAPNTEPSATSMMVEPLQEFPERR